MKKNVASQTVSAVVVSATDGSAVTASVSVTVTGDAGTQGAGGGTLAHEGGGEWSYVPTQAETNFDHIMFKFSATGAIPVGIQLYTTFAQTGDSFARLGAPAGASISADVATKMATYTQPTGFLAATFPTTVASPTNITAGTITTTTNLTNLPSIPNNWLTAAGIAASALNGKGDWNIGKTGYALSSAGVQAIWDALTSALTTVGSIGKLIVDNLNATISSRMASYTQPTGFLAATFPTTVASPALVWDEATAGHSTAGSTGKALTDAGSAGDPWSTAIPGAYGAGTAGKIVGDNLDAAVSTRSTFAGGAVASVTGNVGGNVTGSVGSVVADVNADLKKINGTTVNGDGSGTPWGP